MKLGIVQQSNTGDVRQNKEHLMAGIRQCASMGPSW